MFYFAVITSKHVLNSNLSDFLNEFSGGEPEKPLIVHVGRLGYEKSLDFLKRYFILAWMLLLVYLP